MTVDALFSLERYPTVWTMTSTVSARAPAPRWKTCCGRCSPAAPSPARPRSPPCAASARWRSPRGYCGSIGWLAPDGDFSLNVAIRTLVVDAAGAGVYGVGGGIVHDSDPASEWQECHWKARILKA